MFTEIVIKSPQTGIVGACNFFLPFLGYKIPFIK